MVSSSSPSSRTLSTSFFSLNCSSSLAVWLSIASTTVLALTLRWIKRFFSPTISCTLRCPCGSIQGIVRAKREDSLLVHCYCQDCRQYCHAIASLSSNNNHHHHHHHQKQQLQQQNLDYCGKTASHLVQVCKNALTITKGHELISLARKGTQEQSKQSKQLYMHRYYASCCSVPLFQTVHFLGFVAIFQQHLYPKENIRMYDGPIRTFPKQALPTTTTTSTTTSTDRTSSGTPESTAINRTVKEADIFPPSFLWKLLRYQPWYTSGPMDTYNKNNKNSVPDLYWGVVPYKSSHEEEAK